MNVQTVRIVGVSGVVSAVLLPATMVVLTVSQADFLSDSGWSPVARTPTEWPSLLALGPHGWAMETAFVLAALQTMALSATLWALAKDAPARAVSAFIGLVALGLVGVVFPTDPPRLAARGSMTWHAHIHNGLYPLIPVGVVGGAAVCALWRPERIASVSFGPVSSWLLPVMLISLAMTSWDPVAQLVRYFLFATFFLWISLLTLGLTRSAVFGRAAAVEES